ncbi:MAG: hypothetical protein AAGE94_02530 [Acidobacteriota bacterium]
MTGPTWSRVVLGALVPRDRRDDVLGDLEEVHRQRRATVGPFRAWIATSIETTVLVAAFVLYRAREIDWSLPWISRSDLKLGYRLMCKQPVMTWTSILAIAVGIGVAATGFTVFNAVVHGQLPFTHGDRFVRVSAHEMPAGWTVPMAP